MLEQCVQQTFCLDHLLTYSLAWFIYYPNSSTFIRQGERTKLVRVRDVYVYLFEYITLLICRSDMSTYVPCIRTFHDVQIHLVVIQVSKFQFNLILYYREKMLYSIHVYLIIIIQSSVNTICLVHLLSRSSVNLFINIVYTFS